MHNREARSANLGGSGAGARGEGRHRLCDRGSQGRGLARDRLDRA